MGVGFDIDHCKILDLIAEMTVDKMKSTDTLTGMWEGGGKSHEAMTRPLFLGGELSWRQPRNAGVGSREELTRLIVLVRWQQ